MKITTYGVVLALKNLGTMLASYTVAGIEAEPKVFMFALIVYAFISIPTDLLLMNHLSEKAKEDAK